MAGSIAKRNQATLNRATKALERTLTQIQRDVFPSAMNKLADVVVKHSRDTKTYNDVTGRTKESHFAQVVDSGETVSIEFLGSKGENDPESVSSPRNQVTIFFGAKVYHAIFLERIHGRDVAIQTFLFLRRNFVRLFGDLVKFKRVS